MRLLEAWQEWFVRPDAAEIQLGHWNRFVAALDQVRRMREQERSAGLMSQWFSEKKDYLPVARTLATSIQGAMCEEFYKQGRQDKMRDAWRNIGQAVLVDQGFWYSNVADAIDNNLYDRVWPRGRLHLRSHFDPKSGKRKANRNFFLGAGAIAFLLCLLVMILGLLASRPASDGGRPGTSVTPKTSGSRADAPRDTRSAPTRASSAKSPELGSVAPAVGKSGEPDAKVAEIVLPEAGRPDRTELRESPEVRPQRSEKLAELKAATAYAPLPGTTVSPEMMCKTTVLSTDLPPAAQYAIHLHGVDPHGPLRCTLAPESEEDAVALRVSLKDRPDKPKLGAFWIKDRSVKFRWYEKELPSELETLEQCVLEVRSDQGATLIALCDPPMVIAGIRLRQTDIAWQLHGVVRFDEKDEAKIPKNHPALINTLHLGRGRIHLVDGKSYPFGDTPECEAPYRVRRVGKAVGLKRRRSRFHGRQEG